MTQMAYGYLGQSQMTNDRLLRPVMSPVSKVHPGLHIKSQKSTLVYALNPELTRRSIITDVQMY